MTQMLAGAPHRRKGFIVQGYKGTVMQTLFRFCVVAISYNLLSQSMFYDGPCRIAHEWSGIFLVRELSVSGKCPSGLCPGTLYLACHAFRFKSSAIHKFTKFATNEIRVTVIVCSHSNLFQQYVVTVWHYLPASL